MHDQSIKAVNSSSSNLCIVLLNYISRLQMLCININKSVTMVTLGEVSLLIRIEYPKYPS